MAITTSPPARRVADGRIRRLSQASTRTTIEPDTEFAWGTMRPGRLLADELLSTAGLDLDLSEAAKARLSRAEVASLLANGVRFEAALDAAFSTLVAEHRDLTDPRVTYMLHEIGEETRHSRAFLRLIDETGSRTCSPFDRGVPAWLRRRVSRNLADRPALLLVMVMAGEEIPDLLQKLASEHPETDPLLAAVNRYHRREEARHLAFARETLPEAWARAGRGERRRVRHLAPILIGQLFQTLLHPGVYRAAGLPGWSTWRAANRSAPRRAIRHAGTRPILDTLLDTGVLRRGRVPRAWRRLCGVDRHGRPVPGDVPLPRGPAAR